MSKLKLNWHRVPSVRPGGKRWFWVAFMINADGTRTKFDVVWDRTKLQWLAEVESMNAGSAETVGLFATPQAARDHIETIANEMTPALKP